MELILEHAGSLAIAVSVILFFWKLNSKIDEGAKENHEQHERLMKQAQSFEQDQKIRHKEFYARINESDKENREAHEKFMVSLTKLTERLSK